MSDYIRQNGYKTSYNIEETWTVSSDIEHQISVKIANRGTPLKDWNISIYRGILTGCNEAFIIDETTKEALINADPKSAEIIRPILRGRDVQRYGYQFAHLWLIATFPSKQYSIDDYPAVKKHLLSFGIHKLEQTGKTYLIDGQTVKARKKTNNKWFETQDSIGYWDDFSKQKIVWSRLSRISKDDFTNFPRFALVSENCVTLDSLCFFTGEQLPALIKVLNSEYAAFYFFKHVAILDNGGMQMRQQYVENIPIPHDVSRLENAEDIDQKIYELFGFNEREVEFIKNFLEEKRLEIQKRG